MKNQRKTCLWSRWRRRPELVMPEPRPGWVKEEKCRKTGSWHCFRSCWLRAGVYFWPLGSWDQTLNMIHCHTCKSLWAHSTVFCSIHWMCTTTNNNIEIFTLRGETWDQILDFKRGKFVSGLTVCNMDTDRNIQMQSCFKWKSISSLYKHMHLIMTVRGWSCEMTVKIRKPSLDTPPGPLLRLGKTVVGYDRGTDAQRKWEVWEEHHSSVSTPTLLSTKN